MRPAGHTYEEPRGRSLTGNLIGREVALTLLLFALSYNLVFVAFPHLTSARLCLLGIAVFSTRRALNAWTRFAHSRLLLVTVTLVALVYSLLLSVTSGDWGQTSRIFHFLLYALFGAAVWVALEESQTSFARRFAAVATVQSMFIIISLFSASYRFWLSTVLVRGGNISLDSALRPAGLSNSGGAFLSVVQALGVFAALDAATSASGKQRIGWYLAAFACLLTAFISGRTGLMMALAFILIFVLTGNGARSSLIWSILIVSIVGVVLAPTILGLLRARIPDFDFLYRWATEIFLRGRETGSWSDLKTMPVPGLDSDTFAGTGRLDASGANASGNDSGFIQTYFALGLPMTALFYGALFGSGIILTAKSRFPARFAVLLLAMALIEIKEPFIFKYTVPFFFFTAASLSVAPAEVLWRRRLSWFTLPQQASRSTRPFGPYEST